MTSQPRPQALSPLPPFVVGRKTLVAAGHVTTQNLGGKKIWLAGGVAEYFNCCCGKLSSLRGNLYLKSISVTWPISRADLHLV